MKTPQYSLSFLASLAFVLSGFTFPSSAPMVSRSQVGNVQSLDLGLIVAVRDVVVDGEKTILGLSGGAAVGGAAATPRSYSRGAILAQAGAAVVGAVADSAIEEAATREQAQKHTIELDGGRVIVIIQETPDGKFRQGNRVQVNSGGWGPATVGLTSS